MATTPGAPANWILAFCPSLERRPHDLRLRFMSRLRRKAATKEFRCDRVRGHASGPGPQTSPGTRSADMAGDPVAGHGRGGLASLAQVADSRRERDIWAEWLAEHRHGGDSEVRREMLEQLAGVRDKVLDRAGFAAGESLLDVGCGEGLIGFGALARGAGHVVFSDISQDLLDFCRETAEALGLSNRCNFVRAGADELTDLADASVDVVTTRSVLIYVADKPRSFREFFRVLRAGGRVSLYEPINRFGIEARLEGFWGYPSNGVHHLAERVEGVFGAIQPSSDPMIDFD